MHHRNVISKLLHSTPLKGRGPWVVYMHATPEITPLGSLTFGYAFGMFQDIN